MHNKKITCGSNALIKERILEAFNLVAGPVGKTLGPGGENVVLRSMGGAPTITKDGVTVANSIKVEDQELDLIISIIKEAADKTNRDAGDGTTTATVLAHEIYREGIKFIAAGHRPTTLQKQILEGIRKVVTELDKRAKSVDKSLDVLKKIATVSMNGDSEVANLVAEAVHAIGIDGSVTVQGSRDTQNRWTREDGVRINRGWASPAFSADQNSSKIVFENPYVLITSYDLQGPGQLQDLTVGLGPLVESRRPLLIISSGIGSSFMASLIMNGKNGTLISCPILPPYFGNVRREFFRDLAVLTGARVIDQGDGDQLAAVRTEHLGQADKIEITSSETVIIGGKGKPAEIEKRKKYLKDKLAENPTQDLDKVQERLAKLGGGIGIVELAYMSDIEFHEKKHRVEDAACACKAALESGYLPGGGVTLYHTALTVLDKSVAGEMILLNASGNVIQKLAHNASRSGEVIMETIGSSAWNPESTFDLRTGKVVNALDAGILDPVKVVKTTLMNGGSVAAALLTTGAIISDIPEKSGNPFLESYMPQ